MADLRDDRSVYDIHVGAVDLVDKLRDFAEVDVPDWLLGMADAAADEIERLRAQVAHLTELREAVLRWMDADATAKAPCDMEDATGIALERHRSWRHLCSLVKR